MKTRKYPVVRKNNLVVQEVDGEVLVYDLRENKVFCLNQTSALVWQHCDGEKSVPQIRELINNKLGSSATDDLVWLALDQLAKENLIENEEALPEHLTGISRRDVIRKVGLGTMVALPLVSSIVAPRAAAAQSGCIPTLSVGNVANSVGNCGAGGANERDAICNAACCSQLATGTAIGCTANTLECSCARTPQ